MRVARERTIYYHNYCNFFKIIPFTFQSLQTSLQLTREDKGKNRAICSIISNGKLGRVIVLQMKRAGIVRECEYFMSLD